ncbi:MAG: NF038120 family PEP-CTERM protein, partial [Pseudomonadota bacterium]
MNPILQRLLRAALWGAAALAAQAAGAAVLAFDSVPIGAVTQNQSWHEAGYTLTGHTIDPLALPGDLVGMVADGSDPGVCVNLMCPPNPGHYYQGLNDGVLVIAADQPGAAFHLQAFDASFIGAVPGAAYPALAGKLGIYGAYADGSYAYEEYALAGPGPGGFQFQHYLASPGFAAQPFVELDLMAWSCDAGGTCVSFTDGKGQFALDNVALTAAAVPEPASWTMLGLGLLLMAAVGRRQAPRPSRLAGSSRLARPSRLVRLSRLSPLSRLSRLSRLALLLAGMALDAHADEQRRPYLVQLHGQPVASYTGTMAGLPATRPAPGQRLDLHGAAVQRYTGYLLRHQDAVRSLVAGAPLLHRYQVVLNGFAALLTDDEVRRLQADANVARITADVPHRPLTNYTPTFLGLDQPDGLWHQLGGPGHAGEDVVIGMIDTGVWPENPAYADRVDADGHPSFAPGASLVYGPPTGWHGSCQVGEGFTVANCNNKLIGARYFDAGFQASGKTLHWSEFRSPRDSLGNPAGQGGHGSHTSSTAGGNHGVPANVAGIPMGQVSGMAPRARLAMYKVCWTYNDPGDDAGQNSCWTSDSVAAIEQAVLDGVQVINYSISGSNTIADPVEQAFLHAANAGVFVAASAGNAGPGDTVTHLSPWLTTVGASTHNRVMQATVTLGNGAHYEGASLNTTALPAGTPIVRAEDAGLAGADPTAVKLCFSAGTNGGHPALDLAKAAGKIVVCTRGTSARVDKSLAVLQAGGVGMVMVDNGAGLVAEVHAVPTIHVTAADGAQIQAYAQTPGASAAFGTFRIAIGTTPAPVMANFSSRGPNLFDPNVLKPDLTAPGVDILAGVTPALTMAQRADIVNGTLVPPPAWAFYQGTSMSSPHVAGVAALLRQRHPGWSPAAVKSALMTSATPTFPDSITGMAQGTLPWGQGAGHLNPNGAVDPGLVYDLGPADYQKYLCGTGLSTDCAGGAVASYNLNLASITVNNVLGTTVVSRAVTNVGAAMATYTASVEVPGYTAVVTPASLTLAPGQTLPFTVALTRAGAPDNVWQYGKLRWSDGSHVVTSPVTVRSGRPVDAPAFTHSTLATASRAIGITTGFSGRMGLATGGL